MSGSVGIDVPPGQTHAIKEVGSVRDQTFRQKRSPAARDRKEKEKRKEEEAWRLADSDKDRVRHDGTKGGVGSEEQHEGSGNKSKKENDSKVPGSLVDVVI